MCVCFCAHTMPCVWRSKNTFAESALSTCLSVGSGWVLGVKLSLPSFCNQNLYPLSHLTRPSYLCIYLQCWDATSGFKSAEQASLFCLSCLLSLSMISTPMAWSKNWNEITEKLFLGNGIYVIFKLFFETVTCWIVCKLPHIIWSVYIISPS